MKYVYGGWACTGLYGPRGTTLEGYTGVEASTVLIIEFIEIRVLGVGLV